MSKTSKLLTPQDRILPAWIKSFEAVHGLIQRDVAPPMQEIEIKTVCPQSPQAAIAGDDHIVATGVLRQHLADQEDFIATTLNRLADQNFGLTVGIHFRGVDQSE